MRIASTPARRALRQHSSALEAFRLDAVPRGEAALKPSGSAKPDCAVLPGNRPSNFITVPRIDAFSGGALLALYEHRTFVQGVAWQINNFDQCGVEIGKQLREQRPAD